MEMKYLHMKVMVTLLALKISERVKVGNSAETPRPTKDSQLA